MDPVSILMGVLKIAASGAISEGTKDSYTKLKNLLQKRFAKRPPAKMALQEFENDPQTWEAPLVKAISQAK